MPANRSSYFQSSGNRTPLPSGTLEPASQISGASHLLVWYLLHPPACGGSGKSGRTKGVADMGFPQLSTGSYMGTWVSLAVRAAAPAGREQPSTHSRHMPVTSPGLVLHGPISANTHASICPAPTTTCA